MSALKSKTGECVGDAAQLGKDRAALGLGRVRGEDGLDVQAVEDGLHLPGRHPVAGKLADRSAHALPDGARLRCGLESAFVEHTHALLLLGEVDELEVSGEGLNHAAGLGQGEALGQAQQLLRGAVLAGAAALRQRPGFLDALEERVALLLDDRAPEQVAKKMDLFAKRLDRCAHVVLPGSQAQIKRCTSMIA